MSTYLRQANWIWNRCRSHINTSIVNRIKIAVIVVVIRKTAGVAHWIAVADSRFGVVPYLWNGMRDQRLLTVRNGMFKAILRIRVTDYNDLFLLGLWYLKISYHDDRSAGPSETSVHFYQTIWHKNSTTVRWLFSAGQPWKKLTRYGFFFCKSNYFWQVLYKWV